MKSCTALIKKKVGVLTRRLRQIDRVEKPDPFGKILRELIIRQATATCYAVSWRALMSTPVHKYAENSNYTPATSAIIKHVDPCRAKLASLSTFCEAGGRLWRCSLSGVRQHLNVKYVIDRRI
jgi:hypothetical protein